MLCQVAKIAGEEWKNMTDKQKAPYEEVYFVLDFSRPLNLRYMLQPLNLLYWFLLKCSDGKEEQREVCTRNGGIQADEGRGIYEFKERRGRVVETSETGSNATLKEEGENRKHYQGFRFSKLFDQYLFSPALFTVTYCLGQLFFFWAENQSESPEKEATDC